MEYVERMKRGQKMTTAATAHAMMGTAATTAAGTKATAGTTVNATLGTPATADATSTTMEDALSRHLAAAKREAAVIEMQ